MHGNFVHRLLLLLAAVVSLWAGSLVLPGTVRLRDRYQLVSTPGREGAPPEYVLTSALLGGFRGVFLTCLWQRCQALKQEGKFYEMVQTYNVITKLEPNYTNAWAFAAWDLSFNVSVEFKQNLEERVFWVFRGIDMLREQAIPLNRNRPELYYELSWIFNFKVGQDTDYAHPLYRAYLAQEMQNLLQGGGEPMLFERILALPRREEDILADENVAKAAALLEAAGLEMARDARPLLLGPEERLREVFGGEEVAFNGLRNYVLWQTGHILRTRYGMEPRAMLNLMDKYGRVDWRLPHAHSLYWAYEGWKVWKRSQPEKMTLKYERIVYFSLIKLVERGRFIATEDGMVYGVPDYEYLDAVVKHMDDMMEYYSTHEGADGKKAILTGAKSGYENFLRSAVMQAYFDGREKQARELLEKLFEVSGLREKYDVTVATFVKTEFEEWMSSPSKDRAFMWLDAQILKGYWYLALGDLDGYQARMAWADYFFTKYIKERWKPDTDTPTQDTNFAGAVPETLTPLKRDAVLRILSGGAHGQEWSPYLLYSLTARLRAMEPVLWKEVEKVIENQRAEAERRRALVPGEAPPSEASP